MNVSYLFTVYQVENQGSLLYDVILGSDCYTTLFAPHTFINALSLWHAMYSYSQYVMTIGLLMGAGCHIFTMTSKKHGHDLFWWTSGLSYKFWNHNGPAPTYPSDSGLIYFFWLKHRNLNIMILNHLLERMQCSPRHLVFSDRYNGPSLELKPW